MKLVLKGRYLELLLMENSSIVAQNRRTKSMMIWVRNDSSLCLSIYRFLLQQCWYL